MVLGWIGFLLLAFTPGAWITFGLPLVGLPFWPRLWSGVALSPLVVFVQFYLLRLGGIPFELTMVLLVLVNLPAGYLVWRRRSEAHWPSRQAASAGLMVALVIVAAIAPFLLDAQKRLYTWEAWSQADVVYSLANGELDLEDADLAGVRLSYPWAGHVYQAALSYLAGTPPVSNYIWSNLVWLVCIFGLSAAIIAELGGGQLAQVAGSIWLAFGVNFVGQVIGPLIPQSWIHAHAGLGQIWGDNRYSPWLDKVLFFGQILFALGLFTALAYLLIRSWPEVFKRDYLILTTVILLGIGLIYPILLPVAGALVCARVLVWWARLEKKRQGLWAEAFWLAIGLISVMVITWIYIHLLTEGRNGGQLLSLNSPQVMRWRILESMVVTGPLLVGLILIFRSRWPVKRGALTILAVGALASFLGYILFNIPWWRNEYKFIFTAAICLAGFPGLAIEPFLNRMGRWATPVVCVLTVVLAAPFIHNVYRNNSSGSPYYLPGPQVEVRNFDLQLNAGEPLAALTEFIETETPPGSLLVVESSALHLPTLTRRQLFVAPNQDKPSPGILITNNEMLVLVKGYPQATVDERRKILNDLYHSQDPGRMGQALGQILALQRPVVIVASPKEHASLLAWLDQKGIGEYLATLDGNTLWLVWPSDEAYLARNESTAQ